MGWVPYGTHPRSNGLNYGSYVCSFIFCFNLVTCKINMDNRGLQNEVNAKDENIYILSFNLLLCTKQNSTFFPFALGVFCRLNFWASSLKLALQVPCSQRTAPCPPELHTTTPPLASSTNWGLPDTYEFTHQIMYVPYICSINWIAHQSCMWWCDWWVMLCGSEVSGVVLWLI